MADIIESIAAEYLRYKALAEAAIGQLTDAELCDASRPNENSIAVIAWHLSGNLRSRFTDFLTSDGEKPWRAREEEFRPRAVTHDELAAKWQQGWDVLLEALTGLTDGDLSRTVTIRGQSMGVFEALQRSVAHVAYHVGQIVYVAKALRGPDWKFLSIPPGGSDAYNRDPGMERPGGHTAALKETFKQRRTPGTPPGSSV